MFGVVADTPSLGYRMKTPGVCSRRAPGRWLVGAEAAGVKPTSIVSELVSHASIGLRDGKTPVVVRGTPIAACQESGVTSIQGSGLERRKSGRWFTPNQPGLPDGEPQPMLPKRPPRAYRREIRGGAMSEISEPKQ